MTGDEDIIRLGAIETVCCVIWSVAYPAYSDTKSFRRIQCRLAGTFPHVGVQVDCLTPTGRINLKIDGRKMEN